MTVVEFLRSLNDPAIPFLRYAFLVGILASIAFGIMGSYVVARRISYIAGAISHSVLGGIGAGLYLQHRLGIEWFHPMTGAVISALLAALIIGFVSIHSRQREDTVIGALWAIGMATGLLFLARTPGYHDPMSYIFGNILLISRSDLWVVLGLDVLVVFSSVLFYNKLLAICFDEEYSRIRGIRVDFYFLFLLCLTALTVVLLVRVVGIVLVIALLTLPSAVAGDFSKRLWHMMVGGVALCMFVTVIGLGCSYSLDLPVGPVIIVCASAVYILVVTVRRLLCRFV
jgi:zinc transport system permease protein